MLVRLSDNMMLFSLVAVIINAVVPFDESYGGLDSLVDKALDFRPKGTGFDPRLDHKKCST
jgi:hypothetical protein